MIGFGWRFKDKAPWWFNTVVGFLIVDSALHFGLLMTVSSWADSSRDALRTYPLPFRDGRVYFVQPWLGQYLDAKWIGAGLLLLLVILLFVNREKLERAG